MIIRPKPVAKIILLYLFADKMMLLEKTFAHHLYSVIVTIRDCKQRISADQQLFHGNSVFGTEPDKVDSPGQSTDIDFAGGLLADIFLHEQTAFDIEYFNEVVSG